jgi:spore coat protein A, manganese oxidase
MINRRAFLQAAAVAGAVVFLPWGWDPEAAAAVFRSPSLSPFVDPLPVPKVLSPTQTVGGVAHYEIAMRQFQQQLHRDLPPTTVWGYQGTYPGPTIEARRNKRIVVRWINELPTTHLLPIDHTLHRAEPPTPTVRTIVHLHGGHVPPESDGFPESWFPPGHSATYEYPNLQQATTLWYHDHALGITRLNVYAGLAGFYVLREALEEALNLPSGAYEIPLAIQDRSFQANGQLFYPNHGVTHPVWVLEFFADTALVNGKVWPYLEVEPRKYRFRLLNGSTARFYRLALDSGQPFYQIGSDGGLFSRPVQLRKILLAPAERADVIIDFTAMKGATITVTNDAPVPFPEGGEVELPQIMQFRVVRPLADPDTSALPSTLRPVPRIPEASAGKVRDLALIEKTDQHDNPIMLLLNNKQWADPVTENPHLGTTEIWRLINTTGDTHPIHVHLVQFQILDRQPFNGELYKQSGQLVFTGLRIPPDPNEMGWKDTVRANPGEVTRIIARFSTFAGRYVWHCHILEHEDNEMMRPYEVVAG